MKGVNPNHKLLEAVRTVLKPDQIAVGSEAQYWAKDWTKSYVPNALAAFFPQTTEEAAQVLKLCSTAGVAVVPSGGRTGLSGGAMAIQGEVIISTSRMTQIYDVNQLERWIHCQAGAVTQKVQEAARVNGLFFPVDFASSGSSAIGGNIATNAGGVRVVRYGMMHRWVVGLKVALINGTVLDFSNRCEKNNTGYNLRNLFIGSEGTLGLITECWLGLTTPPGELIVTLFALPDLQSVIELLKCARSDRFGARLQLTAFEFFTNQAFERVKKHTKAALPFSQSTPFYALLETDRMPSSAASHDAALEELVIEVSEAGIVSDGVMAQSSQQSRQFWALRENISESLSATGFPHKNDISVPLSAIAPFCEQLKSTIAKEYPDFEVILFGHIGDGNIHVNIMKPDRLEPTEFLKHAKISDEHLFELVKKFGGSISAEHGVGLTKKPFLNFTRSQEEVSLMRQIKGIFDPQGLMNPGKIF